MKYQSYPIELNRIPQHPTTTTTSHLLHLHMLCTFTSPRSESRRCALRIYRIEVVEIYINALYIADKSAHIIQTL